MQVRHIPLQYINIYYYCLWVSEKLLMSNNDDEVTMLSIGVNVEQNNITLTFNL